ncbi:MAG: carboxypeptidase-like regulatory domain-containing protein, partial [Bacteroidota bacterium]
MKQVITLFFLSLTSIAIGQVYNAGFTSISLRDSSRIYKPDTDANDSLHYRPVELDIWYPSPEKRNSSLVFGDFFKLFEKRAIQYQDNADYSGLTSELAQFYVAELGVGTDGDKLLNIKTNSYKNLNPSNGKHPIILYLAGFNGMGFENYKVLERLAREGFIVVSIWSVGRYPGDMTNKMEDMLEQVYDTEFALNYLKVDNSFSVDTANIGLLGCSWGGMSAAVLAKRSSSIKAMVSYDGTETHYFGETDTNVYANSANGETNDQFIQEIHDANLLAPNDQDLGYLYFESGDKIDDFTPSREYHYFKKLKAQKYYLRFTDSRHADFVCIPSILNSSKRSIAIYKTLEESTVLFFKASLKSAGKFDSHWNDLKLLDNTTDQPYDLTKKEEEAPSLLSGQVVDAQTMKPLPYVNIGILNRGVGTVTNTEGEFRLAVKEMLHDTLRISMIGYKPIEILMEELTGSKIPLTVRMEEQISTLNEIVVTAKAYRKKTLGNKTKSKFIGTGFGYDQLGAEMGIKINLKKTPSFVDAFGFTVSHNRLSAKSIFRINFYSVKNNRPFENILTQNILVPIEPKQTGPITVDLKPYDIILNDDVIVSLEWVDNAGENKEGEAIFFPLGLFTNGTLYKQSSQARFKKHS